jgi:hypothetical protein
VPWSSQGRASDDYVWYGGCDDHDDYGGDDYDIDNDSDFWRRAGD